MHYGFSAWGIQPRGSLRTGYMTLFPEWSARKLEVRCEQGGLRESFTIDGDCNHGRALSASRPKFQGYAFGVILALKSHGLRRVWLHRKKEREGLRWVRGHTRAVCPF